MIDVSLSKEEIEVIRFVVERYKKAMIFEIAHTDSRELREYLVERQELLEALMEKLAPFSEETGALNE